MFAQIDFKNAVGKTIKAVVPSDDDELIVSFDDQTFSFLRVYTAGEDDMEIRTDAPFYVLEHRLDLILEPAFGEAGLAMHADGKAKWDARLEVERMQQAVAHKEDRKRQYDALKAEFEHLDESC